MNISLSDLEPRQIYHLMIQTIIPRPIAWILTQNDNSSLNLAPFSYFNGVSSEPPLMMVSVGKKKTGEKKDTWTNIEKKKQFVIHIAGHDQSHWVNQTSEELEYGESEIDKCELKTTAVEGWPLPRLANSKVAMFCSLYQIYEIGNKPQGMILGQIEKIWLDPEIVKTKHDYFWIDAKKIDPLCRLGSNAYGKVHEQS